MIQKEIIISKILDKRLYQNQHILPKIHILKQKNLNTSKMSIKISMQIKK